MSINVCIFGVSGYTGSTLLKLLNKHRHVNLIGVFGDKTLGKKINPKLLELIDVIIINKVEAEFYKKSLFQNKFNKITKVITLGSKGLEVQFPNGDHKKIQAFKVKVIDHYGQAEGVANFSQRGGKNYQVDEDFSIVEFISTNQKYKYKTSFKFN